MTVDEFTARTRHTPTDGDEWHRIMKDYLRYDWEDKDMFCRRWLIQRGQYNKIGAIIRNHKDAEKEVTL